MWLAVVDAGGTLLEDVVKQEDKDAFEGKQAAIMKAAGLKLKDFEFFQTTVQFINLTKMKFEEDARLPKRQKFWTWMNKSICHSNGTPGPFRYLIEEVVAYDVAGLYYKLARVIDMPKILSQADELDSVLSISFATSCDIFKMHTDMRLALKRLHDMNENLPKKSHIILPESFIRARLIKGMRGSDLYKSYLDKLMCMKPDEWADISVADPNTWSLCRPTHGISKANRRAPINSTSTLEKKQWQM